MPGCFAATESLGADDWDAFRLGARAFGHYCGPDAFPAGWSAVATWRLPVIGRPPDRHSAIRPAGAGRSVRNTPFGDLRAVVHSTPAAVMACRW